MEHLPAKLPRGAYCGTSAGIAVPTTTPAPAPAPDTGARGRGGPPLALAGRGALLGAAARSEAPKAPPALGLRAPAAGLGGPLLLRCALPPPSLTRGEGAARGE
jgi:hypothetical protein